ncbi:hypothetical protein [Xanthomonas citri]|uniref:hypothetical protein n=1 Tax=Xanthomonas citri TaxID=346 RepID=UPI0012FD8337|nr:hypothetical protein [Xanthomonas citri]
MSETNWTPGPWAVSDFYTDCSTILDTNGYAHVEAFSTAILQDYQKILGVDHWADSGEASRHVSVDEQAANAHLIAAAPELYEALDSSIIRQLIGEIEDNPSVATAGLWALAVQWMELRDAALAKARGEA